jgi:hypothetical protein
MSAHGVEQGTAVCTQGHAVLTLPPLYERGAGGISGRLSQANPPVPPFGKGGNGTKAPKTECPWSAPRLYPMQLS